MNDTAPSAAAGLAARVRRDTGLNVARCYQCGKCSAGCPMASETRLRPHDVMRLVARDRADDLFSDASLWLCLSCETCSSRCPNQLEPARVIDALREYALASGQGAAPRAVSAFHRAFLAQIRMHGRVHEVGLTVGFKRRTGDLFSDALAAPGMIARGKLPLLPARIEDVADVRRLFAACDAGEGDA